MIKVNEMRKKGAQLILNYGTSVTPTDMYTTLRERYEDEDVSKYAKYMHNRCAVKLEGGMTAESRKLLEDYLEFWKDVQELTGVGQM